MEISLCDISGIKTKAPCEAALMSEHHVRVEISDFVMRTFILNSALFFSAGLSSDGNKSSILRSHCANPKRIAIPRCIDFRKEFGSKKL